MSFTVDDGAIVGEFDETEATLIRTLATQVGRLLADREPGMLDPAITRLLPSAYPDDAEAAAEFRRYTEPELAERKVRNAETVIASLGPGVEVRLDEAGAGAWVRTLTDIRLTIAARLGIVLDDDHGEIATDEGRMMRDVYDWLGFVQESLVRAMEERWLSS